MLCRLHTFFSFRPRIPSGQLNPAMKPLLILPQRHRPDDADLWRAAIRRGWETIRVGLVVDSAVFSGRPMVRYYGNTLHSLQLEGHLPLSFGTIDPLLLTELPETRRTIALRRFGEITQPLTTACFVKPISEKWFPAKVYPVGATLPEGPLADDFAYVQTPVIFTDELRCYVRGHEILTASLYRVDQVAWDVSELPPEALNFDDRIEGSCIPELVRRIRAVAKSRLPDGVVMDFGKLDSGVWSLIEFNEAWASGLYYCDPDRALDVIVASQSSLHTT